MPIQIVVEEQFTIHVQKVVNSRSYLVPSAPVRNTATIPEILRFNTCGAMDNRWCQNAKEFY